MTRHPVMFALLALPLLPALASACPRSLGDGVRISYEDGWVTELRPAETPGMVRERGLADGSGWSYELLAWHGIFSLRQDDFEDGVLVEYLAERTDYAEPPPVPAPGLRVQGIMGEVTREGESFTRRHDVAVGTQGQISIGRCTFTHLHVQLALFDIDGTLLLEFAYLPALGIAMQTAYEDEEGREEYIPRALEAITATTAPGEE